MPSTELAARRADGRGFEARRVLGALKHRLLGTTAPAKIDRYVVTGRIGQGAMGTVYRARDPKLQRDVAIKLVRPMAVGAEEPSRAAARLLREARAMAAVTHPNIVAVYDAGQIDNEVFVVMELVEGPSLADAFEDAPLPWREATALAVGAGRGLAAAHAHGIVHRDVKPTNIVIAPGHVAKVVDFGLADAGGDEGTTGRILEDALGSSSGQDTRTGTVVGTPAFMAPEQFLGRADERSDQYALCLSLLQAMTGELPFVAGSFAALYSAKTRDGLTRPDGVPDALWSAIQRGAGPDPACRFDGVDELCAALEGALVRRRPWLGVVGGALLLGGLAFWAGSRGEPSACSGAADEIEAVWNAPRKSALMAKIESSGVEGATQIAAWVGRRVDAQADAWSRERVRECGAGGSTAPSPCLSRVRTELHELLTVAEELDAKKVGAAPTFFGGLTLPQSCASEQRSGQTPGLWAELEAEAGRVRALLVAERWNETLRRGAALRDRAQQAGAGGIADSVGFTVALARVGVGDVEQGIAEIEQVYDSAMSRGDFEQAAVAAVEALHQHQSHGAPADTQREWARHAESAVARVRDLPRARSALESGLAKLDWQEGRLTDARDHLEESIALARRIDPHGSIGLARSLGGLGLILGDLGEYDLARDALLESVAMMRTVSPHSTEVAVALQNLSRVAGQAGDADAALAGAREADALAAEVVEPTHFLRVLILGNLASALQKSQECQEAVELIHGVLGDDPPEALRNHPFLASAEQIQAQCLVRLDRPSDAVDVAERAVARLAGSNDKVQVGFTQYQLADALWRSGRDPARAVKIMQDVRDTLATVEGGEQWHLFASEWLDEHPPGDPPLRARQ